MTGAKSSNGRQKAAKFVGRVRRGTRSLTFLVRVDSDPEPIEVSIPRSKLEGFIDALQGHEREFREQARARANEEYESSVRQDLSQMLQMSQRKTGTNTSGHQRASRMSQLDGSKK